MTDLVSCLRDEIVQSENARLDFIKWKIVSIAALGAVGLGLASDTRLAAPAILAFIPIVCAYVDVVCAHVNFRILLIAYFLRTGGSANQPPDSATANYEALCAAQRGGYGLESIALIGTTIAMSFLIALVGVESRSMAQLRIGGFENMPAGIESFLVGSAIVGSAVSIGAAIYRHYWVAKLAVPPAPGTATGSGVSLGAGVPPALAKK